MPDRRTDAWCRKPSSRSRGTRGFRMRSQEESLATDSLRSVFEIRRVEESQDCAPARLRRSEALEQSIREDTGREGESLKSGTRRIKGSAARHSCGFVAREKNTKLATSYWRLASGLADLIFSGRNRQSRS